MAVQRRKKTKRNDEESEGDQAGDTAAEDAVDANEEQGNTQGTAGTINFHVPELKEGTTYVARVSAYRRARASITARTPTPPT